MMNRSEENFHSGGSERRGLQPSSFLVTGVIFDPDEYIFRTEHRNFDNMFDNLFDDTEVN
jgi:hypothetical protein